MRPGGPLQSRMHQSGEVKLGGPAGPLHSRSRERHTIDHKGPVSNGQTSTPTHPIASQHSITQPQLPHRAAASHIAQQFNPFASLAESVADSILASPTEPAVDSSLIADGIAQPPARTNRPVRFVSTRPRIHVYTRTQPLDTRSTTTVPKRGCMRISPTVVDAASIRATPSSSTLLSFRSLLPQGSPRSTPVESSRYHTFTISNASTGPHGGVLLRIDAIVHGHQARCLLDCGATSGFVSIDFIKRHGLEKHMLPTEHLVRGYDGQLTPAAGVIETPVTLSSIGEAKSTPPQQLLAAHLHSDDVILDLP